VPTDKGFLRGALLDSAQQTLPITALSASVSREPSIA